MAQQIRHHLTPGILMAYSAGSLPEAFNIMVASHLSLCDTCRAEAASYDMIGGEVLERTEDASTEMSAGSFDATLALIASKDGDEPSRPIHLDNVLPAPLRDYVGGDLDAVKWKSVGMGVKQAILKTSPTASARLLSIPAGTAMPDHGHSGVEMTMVLKGAFRDEGEYFARGDVELADAEMQHTPVADIHEECICLAVADAPLKFRGLIPRLAQPFLRI
jgi:putative transcriptional regulator